jgi:hypothetical protein
MYVLGLTEQRSRLRHVSHMLSGTNKNVLCRVTCYEARQLYFLGGRACHCPGICRSVNAVSRVSRIGFGLSFLCGLTHPPHLGHVSAAHFEKEAKKADIADRFHGSFVYPI